MMDSHQHHFHNGLPDGAEDQYDDRPPMQARIQPESENLISESPPTPNWPLAAEKKGDVTDSFKPQPLATTRTGYSSFNDAIEDSTFTLPWRDTRWYSVWGILLLDILQILLVLPFVALASLALLQDGKTTEEVLWMPDIITAATYGPTIFPILFAMVLGRLMKAVAYYKLERRTTVKTMEQLHGSRTIVSAFVTQFKMRGYNLLGIAIVLTWALSPIGSQASLRVASIVDTARTFGFDLGYLETRSGYSPDEYGYSTSLAASLFTSTIMMPFRTHTDAQDVWGNVRVPMVEELERQAGAVPSLDWIPMNKTTTGNVTYAALVGLPMMVNSTLVAGERTDLAFSFNTSYWWLDCAVEQTLNAVNFPLTVANYSAATSSTRMGWSTMMRQLAISDPAFLPLNATMEAKYGRFFPWVPRQIYMVANNSITMIPGPLFFATCNLTTTYVAVEAVCSGQTSESGSFSSSSSAALGVDATVSAVTGSGFSNGGQGCRATAVRRTNVNATKATMSVLDAIGVGRDTSLLQNFLNASTTGAVKSGQGSSLLSPNIGYLADPKNAFGFQAGYPDWSKVTARDFGIRLAQELNTFWLASIGYKPIQGNFEKDTDFVLNGGGFDMIPGAGLVSVPRLALQCNRGWTSALLVASGVLLIAGLVTLVLGLTRRVPDVLDNFSSLVKDNPYARLPMGYEDEDGKHDVQLNSMFDGFERARRLRDLPVQIGDVAPGLDNGYVAVGTPETVAMEPLAMHRRYL